MKSVKVKKSHYQLITDSILEAMKESGDEFRMPWHGSNSRPINGITKRHYQGVNVFSLQGCRAGRSSSWATYNQWRGIGGLIRAKSKGAPVVFYLPAKPKEKGVVKDVDDKKGRMVLKFSYVFNRDDVDGLEPEVEVERDESLYEMPKTLEHVEQFISATKAKVEIGGDAAFYRPSTDTIHMPDRKLFYTGSPTEAWYGVLLHETAHWTGNMNRLDRLKNAAFGSKDYSEEELVAEISASLLACDLGIENEPRIDHAQYLAGWMKKMENDETAFPKACAAAERAVRYLHSLQEVESVDLMNDEVSEVA